MTLKYERTKKCQLSSMMTETMPESPSEILEILKAVAMCVQDVQKKFQDWAQQAWRTEMEQENNI